MAETGLSETNVTENQGHKPRRPMMIRRTLASAFVVPLALLSFAGCSGSGGGGGTANSTPGGTVQPELSLVEYGRLVDVYGLQVTPGGTAIPVLFKADVVIGGNIQDQRPTESNLSDAEILYDFLAADPDTLQPRLFIPRDVTGDDFNAALEALDDELRTVSPMLFGEGNVGIPFSVVPRNAAVRLTFSASLGIDDTFFVERSANGQVMSLRNTEAVQLLRIVDDPTQPNGFVPLPVRVIVGDNQLTLDPVLLGTEGLQYQTSNNAAGLPASPDQLGANIRIAIALEGPLAIPGLRAKTTGGLTGLNNSRRNSLVRDFRSGNQADDSADIARGFVRDPLPLRIVGEIPMYLERVDSINAFTQEVTVYKNGLSHEIDRGDVLRFISDSSGLPFGSAEVVVDPDDDLNNPLVQHVRVRIRRVPDLEDIDPSNQPGYPASLTAREIWLVQNAPRAVVLAEFTAGGLNGRDDPRNFLSFTPQSLELNGYRPQQNEFVSPFAGSIVRFTKPVDMATVKWADTFFFAMRDLSTEDSIEDFIANRPWAYGGNTGAGMNPATFDLAKYRTPYLITSSVFDEDGSQTSLRLQPTTGFYLDDTMRNAPSGVDYSYYLHLISDSPDGGIRDLAGNPLDLQGSTSGRSNSVVIPFTVDTRMNGNEPVFADNLAVSIVRRFASRDEDANPSYFLPSEVQPSTLASIAAAYPLEDLFGGFIYLDGKLVARPTTRVRVVADNLNQSPIQQQPEAPAAANPLGWCPQFVVSGANETQVGSNSANNLVTAGIQNPLNPYGCRLQTVWREVDLSLSRSDPFDFNLDIEQMYWAPYIGTNLSFDEFDRVSLWLGHSEYRPVPCVGDFSSLPSLPQSGLRNQFEGNFAWNPKPSGSGAESQSPRAAAYIDSKLTIDPSNVVLEANGVNRFLPLPEFQEPYFVYRDETVLEQGGRSSDSLGSDINGSAYAPYILSPFSMGQGRRWVDPVGQAGAVRFVNSFWNDARNRRLDSPSAVDDKTGGLIGNVALPLLADFWTYCDSSELPAGGGYIALGTNGWQTAVTVQSAPQPAFRALSAGRAATQTSAALCRSPGDPAWNQASGGFTPTGGGTSASDNTFYWIMMDVLKRQTVITNGFVDLYNPHRVPEGFADPRLGPFYLVNGEPSAPPEVLPSFAYEFDPPLSQLPSGTSLVPQFRGASAVDSTPFYWNAWINGPTPLFPNMSAENPGFDPQMRAQLQPTADNFALDPYKAGDAHMRKWDTRSIPGSSQSRNWWTHLYNRTVTTYVENPNDLMDPAYTLQFAGPNETFNPQDIRYVNWRFIASNNTTANPPVSPSIETFSLSFRWQ
ncbi:MAG: hypothetical protein ACI85K_001468 [Hyphomicrobiaceae bacterium]|jgi:hypothetical protein